MSIYDSKRWIADLDETIAAHPELEELAGKSVMITGCSGLICSAIVDLLIRRNETNEKKIMILAAGRNKERVEQRFSPYSKEDWFDYVPYDASAPVSSSQACCDYIIHGASNASPNKIMREPVETMLSNVIGIKYLLDYAIEKKAKRVLYISSSEVYGEKTGEQPFKPDEYGYIDLLKARSAYSVGKRAAETMCASYAEEYGVDAVIVRPGHIYGPTALSSDNRVSSAWAYACAKGENIVMKSDGAQIRSYCYCLDCASAILTVLLKGKSVRAYNISNPESIVSIREMAEILAASADVRLQTVLPTEAEKKGFNPMSNSSLDSTELTELGWKGLFDAKRGFSHTVEILRETTDLKRRRPAD